MLARSLDIVVALSFLADKKAFTYAALAQRLGMSASEVYAAVQRMAEAGLVDPEKRRPRPAALLEYLLHGVKYAFPAKRGAPTRGVPTSYAAPPLAGQIAKDDIPPVWPDPDGKVKGYALEPLHPSVPRIARKNRKLYELLALVDAIRSGRARERKLAETELIKRIQEDFGGTA